MTISQEETDSTYSTPASAIADYLRGSISISYLLSLVWAGRLMVVGAMAAGLLYGIYSVYADGPRYTATMLISPADSDAAIGDVGGGGAAGLIEGLTGTTNTMALPRFTQFMSSIASVGVAHELNKRYDFLCRLYQDDCDPTTHQWRERVGLKEWFNGRLARLGGIPDPNGARTEIDLAEYIRNSVLTATNKTDSLVTLSYTDRKPDFAARFISGVVTTTNDYIRALNRETQKRYVKYLSESVAKTTNVAQRQAIDNLLLQEERQLMMTEVDVPYAAKVLDGPTVVPINRVFRTLVVYALVGLIVGVMLALSRRLLPAKWRM